MDISFQFIWGNTRNVTAELYGISMFSLVRNFQIAFQRGCTTSNSYQQWVRVPDAPPPCQHMVLSVFQISVILIGVGHSWSTPSHTYLSFISSLCHLPICWDVLPIFKLVGLFSLLSSTRSLYSLGNSPLSDCLLQKFSPTLCLSSTTLDIAFHRAKVFNFNEVQLINYFFYELCFWCFI